MTSIADLEKALKEYREGKRDIPSYAELMTLVASQKYTSHKNPT